MAFSFNWAGVNIPTIQGGNRNYQNTARQDAAAAGNALRGYDRMQADKEYADIIGNAGSSPWGDDVTGIQAEIDRLKARNMEIAKILGI